MRFLIDTKKKIIFGWSAKCGCSHIKRIFMFLNSNSIINNDIHEKANKFIFNKLPNDIENYTTIIISRNPYKRIISGFLDKYKIGGGFRHLWKYGYITFSMFVNELKKNDWKMIEKHHFTPQTSEDFNKKILNSKCIKFYDIENIDYTYIETLYNKKIPEIILQKKEGHERKEYSKIIDKYVYDLYLKTYLNCKVDTKYFYNEELKNKVYNFYKNDFIFFNKLGVEYTTQKF